MDLVIPQRRRVARQLGSNPTALLHTGANSIERILPHVETLEWQIKPTRTCQPASSHWQDSRHHALILKVGIQATDSFCLSCDVRRLRVPAGVGSVPRGIALREKEVCEVVVNTLSDLFQEPAFSSSGVTQMVAEAFDEHVVARHLQKRLSLDLDLGTVFRHLRDLSGLTYENTPLSFGCMIDARVTTQGPDGSHFPKDFLERKRYRAFSDGYYTSYRVSGKGAVVEFVDLRRHSGRHSGDPAPRSYFPDWCKELALESKNGCLGLALTRQGDILVFDDGTLRFTHRFGRWQYWNHAHLVDLLKNLARVQRVHPTIIPRVVGAVYRTALDVSFRRSGGLFVIIRNRKKLSDLVRPEDQIGNPKREPLHSQFDNALPSYSIQALPRMLLVELAAIDGAVVMSNKGELLAYGAVLEPRRKGKSGREEGSRTKAAIAASNYGLSVKVSADGDITVYSKGKQFIKV